jgi:hypothetical protein
VTVRGPEGENSFVLRQPGWEEKTLQSQSPVRAYLTELAKVIGVLLAIAGFIALGYYTYTKWGWAVFIFPK